MGPGPKPQRPVFSERGSFCVAYNYISAPSCPDLDEDDQYFGVNKVLGDGISHGSVVKIMCPRNYELIGPQTVECVGGQWQMSLPICERK